MPLPTIVFDREVCHAGSLVTGHVTLSSENRDVIVCFIGTAVSAWKKDERWDDRRKYYLEPIEARHDFVHQRIQLKASTATRPQRATCRFSFRLPVDCPPSFEGTFGYIRYYIHVDERVPFWMGMMARHVESAITVFSPIDLNLFPTARFPITRTTDEKCGQLFCLGKGGRHVVTVMSPKHGYVSGETITILGTVDNLTVRGAPIETINVQFYQINTFRSQQRNVREKWVLAREELSCRVAPRARHPFRLELPIPPTVGTIRSAKIVGVEYFVRVKAGRCTVEVPVLIGNVPYENGKETREAAAFKCTFERGSGAKCREMWLSPSFAPLYAYYVTDHRDV